MPRLLCLGTHAQTNYRETEKMFTHVFNIFEVLFLEGFTVTGNIVQTPQDSIFSIKIKSMINFYNDLFCETDDRLNDKNLCFKLHWDMETLTQTDPTDISCLPCLDHAFSNYILKLIEEKIIDLFQDYGHDCRKERNYRPIS